MFREPKPGYSEIMELMARINPDYPSLDEAREKLKELHKAHRDEYKNSVLEAGDEWDNEAKRRDPWGSIYNYNQVEYRNKSGRMVSQADAAAEQAELWVWREMPTGAPASKQSSTTRDPDHHNYRYYKPIHPLTGRPCEHPQSGWKFPAKPDPSDAGRRSFESLMEEERIAWGEDETKIPQTKGFLHEVETNIGTSVFLVLSRNCAAPLITYRVTKETRHGIEPHP